MSVNYFTRLTPSFLDWRRPSGKEGKCKSENTSKPLYEEIHGFGWEEWLFEDYFTHRNDPEFTYNGFLQGLNQKNSEIKTIKRIYLYTKVCKNNNSIKPGCYYVGYIDNVTHIEPLSKREADIRKDLNAVEIYHSEFGSMLPYASNISFKVKDVHVDFNKVFKQPIELHRGQFRFALYDINRHTNFLTNI